jgi:hypothetical protein
MAWATMTRGIANQEPPGRPALSIAFGELHLDPVIVPWPTPISAPSPGYRGFSSDRRIAAPIAGAIPARPSTLSAFRARCSPAFDALADHAVLELSERPGILEDQFAHWGSGVDVLLIKVEVDATRFQVLNRAEQVHHDAELAAAGIAEHSVETTLLLSIFCTRDAGIAVDFNHLPSPPLGDLPQLRFLVLDRLSIGANAHVERGPTRHDCSWMAGSHAGSSLTHDRLGTRRDSAGTLPGLQRVFCRGWRRSFGCPHTVTSIEFDKIARVTTLGQI